MLAVNLRGSGMLSHIRATPYDWKNIAGLGGRQRCLKMPGATRARNGHVARGRAIEEYEVVNGCRFLVARHPHTTGHPSNNFVRAAYTLSAGVTSGQVIGCNGVEKSICPRLSPTLVADFIFFFNLPAIISPPVLRDIACDATPSPSPALIHIN